MRPFLLAAALLMTAASTAPAVLPTAAIAAPAQRGAVTMPVLRRMVEKLHHETRDIEGQPASAGFEFTVVEDDLDIHILAEFSESGNYVWFKVALPDPPKTVDGFEFLRRNAATQPAHFYLYEDGELGMAVPMDNRLVDAASVQRAIDILVGGVTSSKDLWLAVEPEAGVGDQPSAH